MPQNKHRAIFEALKLFGDVAVRLMLQRLHYGSKHPPAEVYLGLPKLNKNERKVKP